jgi:hypothetical protein
MRLCAQAPAVNITAMSARRIDHIMRHGTLRDNRMNDSEENFFTAEAPRRGEKKTGMRKTFSPRRRRDAEKRQ